jgi:thiamine-phosphate pyrophosphorylase
VTGGLPDRLLVITDRHQAAQPLEAIAAAVGEGGGRWLLLRDRDLESTARRALASRLSDIARRCGMHLSIGGDVALAAACGASVHLQMAAAVASARQSLGAAAVIGVSAHNEAEMAAAAAAGADYVTLSPIFLTASKPGYGPALGLSALAVAARRLPAVALGGIDATRAAACLAAGAAGVAVMGEVMRAAEPEAVVRALMTVCKAATGDGESTAAEPAGLVTPRQKVQP